MYRSPWESADRIALANQRHLLNHFKLVTELGGEVMQVQSKDVLDSIVTACKEKQITDRLYGQSFVRFAAILVYGSEI